MVVEEEEEEVMPASHKRKGLSGMLCLYVECLYSLYILL